VLFTEPTHNTKEVREKMVQTAFEHLRWVWVGCTVC
jgi:actin-related protein